MHSLLPWYLGDSVKQHGFASCECNLNQYWFHIIFENVVKSVVDCVTLLVLLSIMLLYVGVIIDY